MDLRQKTNYYLKLKGHTLLVAQDGLTVGIRRALWINRDVTWSGNVETLFKELKEMHMLSWLDDFTANNFEVYTNNGRDDTAD